MTQKRFIYADNAATTRMSGAAYETMRQYLLEEYGNASQPYSFSRSARNAIKDARTRIAECIGASPSEIYFTSGGTESDNWVIKGGWLQGRSIFTSKIEHHAVLKSCDLVNERGGQVTYVDVDGSGVIDMQHLENSLSQGALLSVMAANNEIGTIEPIADCAQIAHKKGALFHTDAVQAVGHLLIDVHKTGIDFLSASAHKFNGPKGIGFLYMKDGLVLPSLISGGSQEKGLRAGTENVASIVAMAVALEENLRCLKENQEKLRIIEESIIGKVNACGVDYIRNGSSNHLPGLLSLSFPHVSGETILHRMDLMGISISTGSACDGRSNKISHVIEAVKVDDKYAAGTIRISLGKENNISDANMIAEGINKIISGYGKDCILSLMQDNNVKPSEAKLNDSVRCAELDEDLYFLMTLQSGRSSLKRVLLETYTQLSEEEIDRLSESMDNTVDFSATAMTEYEKILSQEKENMATDPPVTDKELAK